MNEDRPQRLMTPDDFAERALERRVERSGDIERHQTL
jgi:hypothetical protein